MPSNKKSGSFNKQREIEKNRRKKRKIRIIIFILVAIITGIIVYLLNSQTFKVKNIDVTGNLQLDKQKIIEQSEIKLGSSIFSNINIIAEVKIKQNGYIEDAVVTKKMPDTIKINVKERVAKFQIRTENEYYTQIKIIVKNIGNKEIHSWQFDINFESETTIEQMWNVVVNKNSDSKYTILNSEYNGVIQAGSEINFGGIIKSKSSENKYEILNIKFN